MNEFTRRPAYNPNFGPATYDPRQDFSEPGFTGNVAAAWRQQWGPQLWARFLESTNTPEPGFNPFDNMDGYERYASELVEAGSNAELQAIKARMDANERDRQNMAGGAYGLFVEMVAGLGDPLNYLPLPIARGVGFIRGAARWGTANSGIAAASEAVRASVDPSVTPQEIAASMGAGFLLGGALGGLAGSLGRASGVSQSALQRRLEQSLDQVDDVEGVGNYAQRLTASAEGMPIERLHPDAQFADGLTGGLARVVTKNVPVRVQEGIDGNTYVFSPELNRWIFEADQGAPEGQVRLVDPDVASQLNRNLTEAQDVIEFKETALLREYQEAKARGDAEIDGVAVRDVRDAQEWVTFNMLRALWRKVEPDMTPDEVNAKALDELKTSRASMSVYGNKAVKALSKMNFSSVAKAINLFPKDNQLTEFALKLGGDYGWAVEANRFGYRAPQSLLVQVSKHAGRFSALRSEIDKHWVDFATDGKHGDAREVQGLNMSGVSNAVKRRFLDREAVQYSDFAEMVGIAVHSPDSETLIRGHRIVPQAVEAAKAVRKLLAQYEREAKQYDVFYNQKGVERRLWSNQEWINTLTDRLYEFLWRDGFPQSQQRAIRLDDGRVFVGETWADIYSDMLDEMDADLADSAIRDLGEEGYGFARASGDDIVYTPREDFLNQRIKSVTPNQRPFVDAKLRRLEDARAERAELLEVQEQLRRNPNRFNNGEGTIESYWPRIYDRTLIAGEREKFVRMATEYFGGGEAARERAEEWTDDIIAGKADDARMSGLSGFRSLNSRSVNWPNSYEIVDPELGTIRLTDFIETNVFRVMEQYTRRMGMKIEAAKMFGDPNLTRVMNEMRDYAEQRYVYPIAELDNPKIEELEAAQEQVDEYMRHITNTRDQVLGTLRTSDPWSITNRSARALQDWMTLALMGRVAITSLPEMFRPMMVAGMRAAWGALFEKISNDMPQVKFNEQFTRQNAAELTGLTNDMTNPRFAEEQRAESGVGGGSKWERWLHDVVPVYYRLNGLTFMTSWLKNWTMLASQHSIMYDAIKWRDAVQAGRQIDKKTALRLSAVGIGERQAMLLAQQPVERGSSGLILPAIQNWQGTTQGRQASRLLLDATIGDMRRSIVTPSVADKPLLAQGVVTSRGERKADNDMFKLPFQFMSYAFAANQKVTMSMLQGRDRSMAAGIFTMMLGAYFANYLKTPENAWKNKDADERIIDAWESSGIGALLLGDMNLMIERYSQNQIGLRPTFGMDPKFGKKGVDRPIDIAGPGIGTLVDLGTVFWDDEMSATERAQMIRRSIIFQNYLLTATFARNLATDVGEAFEQ